MWDSPVWLLQVAEYPLFCIFKNIITCVTIIYVRYCNNEIEKLKLNLIKQIEQVILTLASEICA